MKSKYLLDSISAGLGDYVRSYVGIKKESIKRSICKFDLKKTADHFLTNYFLTPEGMALWTAIGVYMPLVHSALEGDQSPWWGYPASAFITGMGAFGGYTAQKFIKNDLNKNSEDKENKSSESQKSKDDGMLDGIIDSILESFKKK